MWCTSAYKNVVGEAKMTEIFAVYLQASGFQSQSSEYAFDIAVNNFDDMVYPCRSPTLMLIVLLSLNYGDGLSSNVWCRFPPGVR